VQIDGNDVLASYAVTTASLDDARAGRGPRFIEALTYRMGAHTTSDDPTKYRDSAELEFWTRNDPISRYTAFLRGRGESDAFFAEINTEAEDAAADIRKRTYELGVPEASSMFAHVYSEEHELMDAQAAWLAQYEASFEGDPA
jgi:2-oxoisovalerate dehydrogenase E1 component alpha subunit